MNLVRREEAGRVILNGALTLYEGLHRPNFLKGCLAIVDHVRIILGGTGAGLV